MPDVLVQTYNLLSAGRTLDLQTRFRLISKALIREPLKPLHYTHANSVSCLTLRWPFTPAVLAQNHSARTIKIHGSVLTADSALWRRFLSSGYEHFPPLTSQRKEQLHMLILSQVLSRLFVFHLPCVLTSHWWRCWDTCLWLGFG